MGSAVHASLMLGQKATILPCLGALQGRKVFERQLNRKVSSLLPSPAHNSVLALPCKFKPFARLLCGIDAKLQCRCEDGTGNRSGMSDSLPLRSTALLDYHRQHATGLFVSIVPQCDGVSLPE
jgi:hypothetical protein